MSEGSRSISDRSLSEGSRSISDRSVSEGSRATQVRARGQFRSVARVNTAAPRAVQGREIYGGSDLISFRLM